MSVSDRRVGTAVSITLTTEQIQALIAAGSTVATVLGECRTSVRQWEPVLRQVVLDLQALLDWVEQRMPKEGG